MRGRAIETSRSRNSYMRSPRSVTLVPTGMPSRILKPAIDLRARRSWARCPAIMVSSSIAASRALDSVLASPTPMLSVIFSIFGTSMTVLLPSSSFRRPRSSSLYCTFRRGTYSVVAIRPPSLPVDLLAAVGALADTGAVPLALDVLDVMGDPRRPVADRADDHHVGDRDRRRPVDDPARDHLGRAHPARILHRPRLHVPLDRVQVLDDDLALAGQRANNAALLAAVLAGQHLDEVALVDLHLRCGHVQSTSGASETIFMKLRSRSSRATGPKIRVPRGLRWASMITAAFSSNAICVPSSRPKGFFVRTATARTTSPFLIAPCGGALF